MRSITRGHHLIVGLFHRGVSSGAVCPSRGPPQASSSPLGAYSSPAGHHITQHILTSPLYFPHYAQRRDWVRGHGMSRDQHASLTCRAVVTPSPSGRYDQVFACATPTYISRQTRTGSCSGTSSLVVCTILVANHAGHNLIRDLFLGGVSSTVMCPSTWSPVRLLITSRDIQQPSRPSHHTTQSDKSPIPPAVSIYSGRASSFDTP